MQEDKMFSKDWYARNCLSGFWELAILLSVLPIFIVSEWAKEYKSVEYILKFLYLISLIIVISVSVWLIREFLDFMTGAFWRVIQ